MVSQLNLGWAYASSFADRLIVKDWAKGRLHVQVWIGNELSGGREQSDCERDLAPTHGMAVIRNPGRDYRLDTTPLYSRGATDSCRMDHRYSLLNNDVFCYGRREKTAGRKRKKPTPEKQAVIESPKEEAMERTTELVKAAAAPVRRPAIIL